MQYIPPQVAVRIKRLCGERTRVEPLEDAALKARRRIANDGRAVRPAGVRAGRGIRDIERYSCR